MNGFIIHHAPVSVLSGLTKKHWLSTMVNAVAWPRNGDNLLQDEVIYRGSGSSTTSLNEGIGNIKIFKRP
jgi:hypothetical protein